MTDVLAPEVRNNKFQNSNPKFQISISKCKTKSWFIMFSSMESTCALGMSWAEFGGWNLVLGAWDLALDTCFLVLDIWCLEFGAWCLGFFYLKYIRQPNLI
jgi:hypothetical protein